MNPDEIETSLQEAFSRCDAASCPLTDMQKQILLRSVNPEKNFNILGIDTANPLDDLTSEELEVFIAFIKKQAQLNVNWKTQLLNDWLQENNSGEVQFIRDRYGLQWLERVEKYHFDKYLGEDRLTLQIGDRIEVCNALWEWVQDTGPCQPEWFPCTVIHVDEIQDGENTRANCIIRFNNGTEYEIQGIYQWNRYNWRWGRG